MNETIIDYGMPDSGVGFLKKPFIPNTLETKIRQALA
jgi:hypothetical protein